VPAASSTAVARIGVAGGEQSGASRRSALVARRPMAHGTSSRPRGMKGANPVIARTTKIGSVDTGHCIRSASSPRMRNAVRTRIDSQTTTFALRLPLPASGKGQSRRPLPRGRSTRPSCEAANPAARDCEQGKEPAHQAAVMAERQVGRGGRRTGSRASCATELMEPRRY
jgi:hypothetical protein